VKTFGRAADRHELVARIRTVRPDSRPRWGRMSAHQMICHLADAFRMAAGKRVTPDTNPFKQTIVKWVALRLPVRWPRGVQTSPEIDQHGEGTRPVEFAADAAALVALMEELATRPQAFDGRVHPVFGRMSRASWLRWAYLHTDHHLRQFGA
jgi:hypothetical protein